MRVGLSYWWWRLDGLLELILGTFLDLADETKLDLDLHGDMSRSLIRPYWAGLGKHRRYAGWS